MRDDGERLSEAIDGDVRTLAVIYGDQLSGDSPALASLDPERDAVLMMEVRGESAEGPSHVQRTVLFLAAMRHFALELMDQGFRVRYVRLDNGANTQSLSSEVARAIDDLAPSSLATIHPGDWRLLEDCRSWEARFGLPVTIHDDPHFFTTPADFANWADGRKSLTMEFFYREQRKRLNVLMEPDGKTPAGGEWNYDKDNRHAFKKTPTVPKPYRPRVDRVTRDVIAMVEREMPELPGRIDADRFAWPVTSEQASRALDSFIEHRLPLFGKYEDAMWTGEPFVYHALLAAPLNLHLLDPREAVRKAVEAYERGVAPLNSVEGFVRQLIGWREFIRGVYWLEGPGYRERNFLGDHGSLPELYWTGATDMRCLSEAVGSVLDHGFAHHIPRLMVLSNFAMLLGVHPRELGDWFYGMFVDSVDWVTTPNTIGMGMHADGVRKSDGTMERAPVVGTKPYAASGKYISRMSNYCENCAYDVKKRSGESACPFNTLYWEFLMRHEDRFAKNHRMAMIMKNVARLAPSERAELTVSAKRIRTRLGVRSVETDGGES
ncbi:MAG: cryptochrome/photolyase family protein [Planctomycetota bacterium]